MTKHDPEEDRKKKKPKPKPKPKPKRFRSLLIIPALMLAGCASMIHVDAIDGPVNRISDRHDTYVREDELLSQDEKDIYLRTTELLRRILAEAKKR